jgi:hypothetical protein
LIEDYDKLINIMRAFDQPAVAASRINEGHIWTVGEAQ